MSFTGAFAPCGQFMCGAGPAPAEGIYAAQIEAVKDSYDVSVGTHVEASIYMRAIALGGLRVRIRHAAGQRRAETAVETLPDLEETYGAIPSPGDSNAVRRAALVARRLISRGSREESLKAAMLALLGDDFVELRVVDPADRDTWPSSPGDVGVFEDPARPAKFFRLTMPIAVTGAPYEFTYRNAGAETTLRLRAGDRVCFQLENTGLTEAVTITDASEDSFTATTTFTKAHGEGASIVSHAPLLTSNQRSLYVVVTDAAARQPAIMRRVRDQLERMVKSVTMPFVVSTEDGLHTGPFEVGAPLSSTTAEEVP